MIKLITTNLNINQLLKTNKARKRNNNIKNDLKPFISKTCKYNFFSANEINISEKIKNIPYYYIYYLTLHDYDFIKVGQLGEKVVEELDSDDKLNDTMNYREKYLLFQYKNISFFSFEDFLFGLNSPKQFILHILTSFSDLLDSLIILNDNNICFFDLSTDNIIFNKENKLLLQNFQNSIYISKLNESFITDLITNVYDFTNKPLEVHVLFYLIKNDLNTLTDELILSITNKYVENLDILNLFSLSYKDKFKKECIEILNKYKNKPKSDIICDIIEYNETWDSYSISIIYLHIIGNVVRVFELKGTFLSKLIIGLMKNIHPNPTKRENTKSIKHIYNGLFEEFQDWAFINKIPQEKLQKLLDTLKE
jgi:hypothetical protein